MSRNTLTSPLLLAFILVSGCQTAAVFDPAKAQTVSIKEARSMSTGESVRVSGIVTVQSGAFASSISTGFAVQDESAGIYVVDSNHALKLGDRVNISGERAMEFGQLNIILESAEILAGSGTITPRSVKTGSVGEAEEGILVQVEGYVTRKNGDPPYGYKVFIDDSSGECQIFINTSTGLVENARELKVGDFILVMGFSGQYEKTYEIMPRVLSDITNRGPRE